MPRFHIRIAGNEMVFSAAHFLVLKECECEPLHQHAYRVTAEIHGPLDHHGYVVDFHAAMAALKNILAP